MSFNKRIRLGLDPDLQPALRNQPAGANDSGRNFLDGSSFSSSTSGGSGAYGRNSGPFRTRYSSPAGGPSPSGSSFSRFAPYYFGKDRRTSLRVPLIRARRDDSDSEGYRPSSRASLNSSIGGESVASATSTTAQRIIETLQNLSTPVMNAGKVRIDQEIKAVQPLMFGGGSPVSRTSPGGLLNRSTGPPKMCSSLLLSNPSPANQTSPMLYNNPGDQRRLFYIPRMIDVATNTDKEEASPLSQGNYTSKPIAPPAKSHFLGAATTKPVESTLSKDDNSEEEFHECSSDFAFSKPWGTDVFERYLKSDKSPKGQFAAQQRLNGFKDSTSSLGASSELPAKTVLSQASSTSKVPSFLMNTAGKNSGAPPAAAPSVPSFSGGSGSTGFGSSPLHKDSPFGKSPLHTSPPFGSSSGNTSGNAVVTETNKPGSSFSGSGFSYSKPGSSPLKSSDPPINSSPFGNFGSKDIKSTASLDKVDAAKTNSPLAAKSQVGSVSSTAESKTTLPPLSSLTKPLSSKWRCSTCMVENDPTIPACVCCGEKNPKPAAPKATSVTEKKWRCSTCMVENKAEDAKCVCCSEKNPNPLPASSSAVSASASKKWRCPTCMVENEPTTPKCVCCSEKNPNPAISEKQDSSSGPAATPFKFGINSSVSSSTPSTGGSSSFVFGAPAQSDTQKPAVTASNFQFGLSSSASSSSSTISSPVVSSSSSQPAGTTTTSTFKFGSTPVSSPSSKPMFGFNTSTSTTSTAVSAVNTPTTASNSMFSTPAPKITEAGSSSTSTPGLFGSSSTFQNTQSTLGSSFKFGGSSAGATSEAQKSPATPSFSFGASAAKVEKTEGQPSFAFGAASNKPAFNSSFSFGDRTQNPTGGLPGATPASLTPAVPAVTTPAPIQTLSVPTSSFSFGSSNPTASPFGQSQSNMSNPSPSPGMFQFGSGGPANPPAPNPTQAPAFSLTPNLNFGSTPTSSIPFGNPTLPTPNAGSQPPPALFQFNSAPTSESPGGPRRIKKAVRRFNK